MQFTVFEKKNKMNRSDCAVAAVGSYFDYEKGMYAGKITNWYETPLGQIKEKDGKNT